MGYRIADLYSKFVKRGLKLLFSLKLDWTFCKLKKSWIKSLGNTGSATCCQGWIWKLPVTMGWNYCKFSALLQNFHRHYFMIQPRDCFFLVKTACTFFSWLSFHYDVILKDCQFCAWQGKISSCGTAPNLMDFLLVTWSSTDRRRLERPYKDHLRMGLFLWRL